jgi:hypothetical protein
MQVNPGGACLESDVPQKKAVLSAIRRGDG